jgi:metal-responsive CopG/Arc/MetJ family transcriptional regulator
MPKYQYVQIGFEPETLNEIDEQSDNRSEFVRQAVEEML